MSVRSVWNRSPKLSLRYLRQQVEPIFGYASHLASSCPIRGYPDAKPPRDVIDCDSLPFEGKRRVAGHNEKPAGLRKRCQNIIGNPISQILLLGVTTQVRERENGYSTAGDQRPETLLSYWSSP